MVGMFGIVFANLAGDFNTTNLPARPYNFTGQYEFMNIEPENLPGIPTKWDTVMGWLFIAAWSCCENLNNLRKTGAGDAIILLVRICDLKRKRLR
jgi:hypothetical protein